MLQTIYSTMGHTSRTIEQAQQKQRDVKHKYQTFMVYGLRLKRTKRK